MDLSFSAEEKGLYGSLHYVKEPVVPLEKTTFMLNLDMIGRAAEVEEGGKKLHRLVVSGTGTSDGFDKLCDAVNARIGLKLMKTPAGSGPSDHQSFYQKKIPVIFAHTGFFAAPITQPHTSSRISGFSPIAAPIFRSGNPCGHEKFSSNPSTPAS